MSKSGSGLKNSQVVNGRGLALLLVTQTTSHKTQPNLSEEDESLPLGGGSTWFLISPYPYPDLFSGEPLYFLPSSLLLDHLGSIYLHPVCPSKATRDSWAIHKQEYCAGVSSSIHLCTQWP